jgi:hypothetical protein
MSRPWFVAAAVVAATASLVACRKDPAPTVPPTDSRTTTPAASACGLGMVEITAQPHDADRDCLGPLVPVGCMPENQSCDDEEPLAIDPEGQLWGFADNCLPGGWTMVPYRSIASCPGI